VVKLYVKNWRCIEEAEVSLEPVTVFIGRNSTGKSSLAYTPYFLTRATEWGDANRVLIQLYGVQLDGVVRCAGEKKFYPIVVEAGSSRFEARGPNDVVVPKNSPWAGGFLLPSQRISFVKLSQLIPKLSREVLGRHPEAKILLFFASSVLEMLKSMPLTPSMLPFLEDFAKLYRGKGFSERRELSDVGILIEEITPLLSLIIYDYVDPFTGLRLPLDLAPDGFVDSALIETFVEKAPENSLVVIEEPEIHKNPILVIELAKRIAKRAAERGLTLVMTTHNDLVVQAIAKAVEERAIKPDQAAVYYFERSREHPWTRVKKIEVYEDGTVEELPDAEKAIAMLF